MLPGVKTPLPDVLMSLLGTRFPILQSNGMKSRYVLQQRCGEQQGFWEHTPPPMRVYLHPSEREVLGEERGLVLQDQGPSLALELGATLRAVGRDAARPSPSSRCPLTAPLA